jgi:hypothetical protein
MDFFGFFGSCVCWELYITLDVKKYYSPEIEIFSGRFSIIW